MADVIDILSSGDEAEAKENGKRKSPEPSVTLEPIKKKVKLTAVKSDIIVLTDEEDEVCSNVNTSLTVNSSTTTIAINNATVTKATNTCDVVIDLDDGEDKSEPDINENTKETEPPATNGVDHPEDDDDRDSVSSGHSSGKENGQNSSGRDTPSVKDANEVSPEMEAFIDACRDSITKESTKKTFEEKVPLIKKAYAKASRFAETDEFKVKIEILTNKARSDRKTAIIHFQEVFMELKKNYDADNLEMKSVRKLYSLYRKVQRRITHLETKEVDFDEEENSSFMKMHRYRKRAADIYKKIQQLEKKDPYFGSVYHSRLDFASSSYPEINRAINKKFQDRIKIPFPTFAAVDKCIRKCVQENNLNLHGGNLEFEIKHCFDKLGNLVQRKRKQDLASIHYGYLTVTADPALQDPELNKKLIESRTQGESAINKVCEKYVILQNKGVNPELSEDSDDSNLPDSDEEDNVADDEPTVID